MASGTGEFAGTGDAAALRSEAGFTAGSAVTMNIIMAAAVGMVSVTGVAAPVGPGACVVSAQASMYTAALKWAAWIDRHQRMVERRIRAARFPAVKSLDTFDFPAIPSLNKALVLV